MFLSKNKKNNVYPCKPQFYYIKVGFKGVKIIYTERKKKRRVNFIPKFHSKKFVKYFTMITKRYMYGTKVSNFIGL